MFDIDSGKLLIVAVLALIVIGPKELPRVLRQVGQAVGKMRRMATEFQGQFMDAMKEADIADIRKELDELNKTAALDVHFNPARDIQAELTGAMSMSATTPTDPAVPSPAEGFSLPSGDGVGNEVAAGIAPVAELVATDPIALAEPADQASGLVHDIPASRSKRKIFVKRRLSSFNVVQASTKALQTGEPLAIQHRVVRPKIIEPQSVQSS